MSHQFLNFNEHSSFSDILRYNWTVRQWIRTWIYPDFEIPQLGASSRRLECNWSTVNSRWETWPIWSLGPPDQIWKCGSRHSKRSSSRGKIVMIASWIYGYPFFFFEKPIVDGCETKCHGPIPTDRKALTLAADTSSYCRSWKNQICTNWHNWVCLKTGSILRIKGNDGKWW